MATCGVLILYMEPGMTSWGLWPSGLNLIQMEQPHPSRVPDKGKLQLLCQEPESECLTMRVGYGGRKMW